MNRSGDQLTKLKSFSLYHLPAVLYGLAILALSSIPSLSIPGPEFTFSDKLAHLLEYAIFAALLFRLLTHLSGRADSSRNLVRAGIFLTIFAIADEIVLQRFVPGRHSDFYDLVADLSGVCLVLAGVWVGLWFKSNPA